MGLNQTPRNSKTKGTPLRREHVRRALLVGLTTLVFPILLEVLFRASLSVAILSTEPFLYGFDPDLSLEIISFRRPEITLHRYSSEQQTPLRRPASIVRGEGLVAFAFGGSTTTDLGCTSASSDWPAALQRATPGLTVVNYSAAGSNSDYAHARLVEVLKKNETPHLVLWANRVNETDVIAIGPRTNLEQLTAEFPYLRDHRSEASKVLVKRLSRTLHAYSVFYVTLHSAVTTVWDLPGYGMYGMVEEVPQVNYRDEQIRMAMRNYELNTLRAVRLAEDLGFQLVLTVLPIRADLDPGIDPGFLPKRATPDFLATLESLASSRSVTLLNTLPSFENERHNISEYFCDRVHMTHAGNEAVAREVSRKLKELLLIAFDSGTGPP